jgi:hypothetical protein
MAGGLSRAHAAAHAAVTVVFYTHHRGRGMEEAARIAHAHIDSVIDCAVCRELLATASLDKTAAVWNADSRDRFGRLRGHTNSVLSVDMNDRLVDTASWDTTVRVYNAEHGYSCTAVLDWIHTACVYSVALSGGDHILSTSLVCTMCVTQLLPCDVVARTQWSYPVKCAAVLLDGRHAVSGWIGSALVDAAVHVLRAHGAAAFPARRLPLRSPPQSRCRHCTMPPCASPLAATVMKALETRRKFADKGMVKEMLGRTVSTISNARKSLKPA